MGAALLLGAAAGWAQTARKPAAVPAPAIPGYGDLKYPELRPIATPAIEVVTLPNGLRVLLLENHELPLFNGTVIVRTGSAFDPSDRFGLAEITEQVLLQGGTLNRPPAEDLTRRFQDLGSELRATVAHNVTTIYFSGLKDNANGLLDALKDGLTAPEFPQDRIDLVKAHMRTAIAHRNDDGATIARRELAALVYGKNSPYGGYVENTGLDRINRGDLVDFYQRYFFPKNVMIALEGDFDAAKMKARVTALFDDWTSDQPAVADTPVPADAGAPGRFLAVKKELTRSYFAIGLVGGDYLEKDYAALEIMTAILGGGPQGRLNQQLHDTVDNLTAVWTPGLNHPGLFTITGTLHNPFYTTKTLQTIDDEVKKLRTEQVTDQELKSAKAAALNSLVFGFESPLDILPLFAQYRFFNFPADYPQQYQRALENVTRADVQRVARERLDPAKMTTVVVGNPTGFENPLQSLGATVTPIDLTIPASKPEATLGDLDSQRNGKQLLTRAQQAMGGADKLAAVSDYTSELDYQFDASVGGAQASVVERWLSPNYLRQDTTATSGKVSVFSDGRTGWIAGAGGTTGLAGVQLKQVQSDLFRVLFPLVLSDRVAGRRVNGLDAQTAEISDNSGQIVKVVFDPATGLIKSVLYDATTVNGVVAVLETYSEFREVAGLKLPSKIAITISGRKYQEVMLKSIRVNTGLKLQDLEKRP
jgi:zinc protease